MRLPLRKKTITGWMIACVLFIGLLGYEWMPANLRGGWIFYLFLIICGAFVEIGTALIVGLLAFIGISMYLLYKLNLGLPAEKQTLMMLLSPIAPLWLSAINHNLRLRRNYSSEVLYAGQKTRGLQPLENYEDFQMRVQALCRSLNLKGYTAIQIDIVNQELVADLLGAQVWVQTKNRVLKILESSADQPVFHFANEDLSIIQSLDMTRAASDEAEPAYIAQLRDIVELNLEISIFWCSIQEHTAQKIA